DRIAEAAIGSAHEDERHVDPCVATDLDRSFLGRLDLSGRHDDCFYGQTDRERGAEILALHRRVETVRHQAVSKISVRPCCVASGDRFAASPSKAPGSALGLVVASARNPAARTAGSDTVLTSFARSTERHSGRSTIRKIARCSIALARSK